MIPLFYMRPCLSIFHLPDTFWGDLESPGQRRSGKFRAPDYFYHICIQLRETAQLTAALFFSRTIPDYLVANIVRVSSGIQMFGVYTSRIITMVKNVFPFRNGPKMQYPRGSMGELLSAEVPVEIALPITFQAKFSLPYPAGFGLFNTSPKSSFPGNTSKFTHAVEIALFGEVV